MTGHRAGTGAGWGWVGLSGDRGGGGDEGIGEGGGGRAAPGARLALGSSSSSSATLSTKETSCDPRAGAAAGVTGGRVIPQGRLPAHTQTDTDTQKQTQTQAQTHGQMDRKRISLPDRAAFVLVNIPIGVMSAGRHAPGDMSGK